MEWDERITYSSEEMMHSVENALDKLNILRYDGQYRVLLGEQFIEKIAEWDQNIRRRKKDPFTVVVIGDFKRGKSTFINALLGEEVVPTDVTTETVTLNRISYGTSKNEAVLSGNRRLYLSDEELKREQLEKIIGRTGEHIQNLELRRPCEKLKNMTIIDTPGIGDALNDFSDMVEQCLIQADAVVYIYSVKYPLSQSEQLFLKAAVLPQHYTKLFIVGNYADTLENERDYNKVRNAIEKRIHNLLPDVEILMISALDELCRKIGEERPCKNLESILEEQFHHLSELLDELIEEKKDTVILDRMQRLTTFMFEEIREQLDVIESGLTMSQKEAEQQLENLQIEQQSNAQRQVELMRQLDNQIIRMQAEANEWMLEFLKRIQEENQQLSNVSTENLLKYYSFYCIDLLQEAMNTCLNYHQEQIFETMEGISNELAKNILGTFQKKDVYNFRFNLDNKVWTKGDTVGFAVSYLGTTGFLGNIASLVADGLSGVMKQGEVERRKPNILSQITTQMSGLEVSIAETIKLLYGKLGETAKKMIREFYEEELQKTEYIVNQSIAIANREQEEKEKIHEAVKTARNILNEAVQRMKG